MDKTTIILLIIIILICCSLLIITGYISFKVYTKPTQIETEQQPSIPPVITSQPTLTKRDIPKYTIDPESLSITLPTPEDLLKQKQISGETGPVPFNMPTGKKITPVVSPKQMSQRTFTIPSQTSRSSVKRM